MMLDEILANTRATLQARQRAAPEAALRAQAESRPAPLDLAAHLRGPGVAIIAEIKRASPSRGALNLALDPKTLAATYAASGADALSVLTEPLRFHGSLEDLAAARQGMLEAGLACPILRKDFILDPYQLLEARCWGADAVLLIVAILDDATLARLYRGALDLGLTPLVEVHDGGDLARALPLRPAVIGINNRNLKDMTVDLETTRRLRSLIPPSVLVVAESGIHTTEHMRTLAALRVDAALIGEALVTAPDPAGTLRALKEAGR